MSCIRRWKKRSLASAVEAKEGILYYEHIFYIGKELKLKQPLMEEFHSSLAADHGGLKKIIRLSQLFYWPKMHEKVKKICGRMYSLSTNEVLNPSTHEAFSAFTNSNKSLG